MSTVVLRLGHRKKRDARVSTHCGLVARAFGADEIIFSGEPDPELVESVKSVVKNWGGPFRVLQKNNWRTILRQFKGIKVHLTMYGLPMLSVLEKVRKEAKKRDLLIIIGSEKVPGEVYGLADYNLAVSNQPHSEVAALAVFLHEVFDKKELNKKFKAARLRIIPAGRGKNVVSKS